MTLKPRKTGPIGSWRRWERGWQTLDCHHHSWGRGGGHAAPEVAASGPYGLCVRNEGVVLPFGLLCVCVGESADAGGSGKGGEQEEGGLTCPTPTADTWLFPWKNKTDVKGGRYIRVDPKVLRAQAPQSEWLLWSL